MALTKNTNRIFGAALIFFTGFGNPKVRKSLKRKFLTRKIISKNCIFAFCCSYKGKEW